MLTCTNHSSSKRVICALLQPSSGNTEVHNCWREYFDQPRAYTISVTVMHPGLSTLTIVPNLRVSSRKVGLEGSMHSGTLLTVYLVSTYTLLTCLQGTLSICTSPLSKTKPRPATAPHNSAARRRKKKSGRRAWDDSHHVPTNPGFYRNRLHKKLTTMPTTTGDLRSTVTWALSPRGALANVLLQLRENRPGGILAR